MEDGREPYRRGPGHTRSHPYDGYTSPRDHYYGGSLRDALRRPTYDRGFASPLGRAGMYAGMGGPASPERNRSRACSPDRRPCSPEHDRRAYSPDITVDRDRAPRYQVPDRVNSYRSRDDGFRRETYCYRGDGSDRPPAQDLSTDQHHRHYVPGGRDALQPLRERCSDLDLHVRPNSREGTALDGWTSARSHGKIPLNGLSSARARHRGGSTGETAPVSSGSHRGGVDYVFDTGPSSIGDLEAGEVAQGPASQCEHGHQHSSSQHDHHHGHNQSLHAGPGPGLGGAHHLSYTQPRGGCTMLSGRGSGTSGRWELKSSHCGPGPVTGPASDGPLPYEGGLVGSIREVLTRDVGQKWADVSRDGGGQEGWDGCGREVRDTIKAGSRATSPPSASLMQVHPNRHSGVRLEFAFRRDGLHSALELEHERDRDRERDKSVMRSAQLHPARSTSLGGISPPSPGCSGGEVTGAAATALQKQPSGAGDAFRGQEPYGDRRWYVGSGVLHGRRPSLALGPPLCGTSGLATGFGPVPTATPPLSDADRRHGVHAQAAGQLDGQLSGGTDSIGFGSLDRKYFISGSQGQAPVVHINLLGASAHSARVSTTGSAHVFVIESTPTVPLTAHAQGAADRAPPTRNLAAAMPLSALACFRHIGEHNAMAAAPQLDVPAAVPAHTALSVPSSTSREAMPRFDADGGSTHAKLQMTPSLTDPASTRCEMNLEVLKPAADTSVPPNAGAHIPAAQASATTAATPPETAAAESQRGEPEMRVSSALTASVAPVMLEAPLSVNTEAHDARLPEAASTAAAAISSAIGLAARSGQLSGPCKCLHPSARPELSVISTGMVCDTVTQGGPLGASAGKEVGSNGFGTYTAFAADLHGGGGNSGAGGAAPTSRGSAGDDRFGMVRRCAPSIRRFGFGRSRRAQPGKSVGEAVPEEGELSNATMDCTPTKTTDDTFTHAFVPYLSAAPPIDSTAVSRHPLTRATSIPSAYRGSTCRGLLSHLCPYPPMDSCSYTPLQPAEGLPPPMKSISSILIASLGHAGPLATQPAVAAGMCLAGRSASPLPSDSAGAVCANRGSGIVAVEVDGYKMRPSHEANVHIAANTVIGAVAAMSYASASYTPAQLCSRTPIRVNATTAAGANAGDGSGETVAGLSQRIEYLELEITDIERQLAALVVEASCMRTHVSQLDSEVSVLDEQLLEDSSSDGGEDCYRRQCHAQQANADMSGTAAGKAGNEVDKGTQAVVECSADSTSTRGLTVGAVAMATPVEMELTCVGAAALGNKLAAKEPRGKGAHDDGNGAETAIAERKPWQELAANATTAPSMQSNKSRGRPRSNVKMRAAEAAAAAAAAADKFRKGVEEKPRVPSDGLLHLPAQQFVGYMLDTTRRGATAVREDVLQLLPSDLAARIHAAIDAAATHQLHLAGSRPAPGGGCWAMIMPLVIVRGEPLYREPQDLPGFHANAVRHAAVHRAVGCYLRQRQQLVAAKQGVLVAQYANNMVSYKQFIQSDSHRRPMPPPPLLTGRGTASAAAAALHGIYSTTRCVSSYVAYSYCQSDVIRTDRDEQRLLNNFQAVEQLKCMCALPDMVLDSWEQRWRAFDNRNGLIMDPVRELEEERIIKAWPGEERVRFMDKFLAHPKDFRKISTFLPGRSPGDCVAFFYKSQKLDEFGTVRRKQQLKKRRLQADMRKQQYAPLQVAPMIARQRAMGPSSGPDGGVRGARGRASGRTSGPGRVRAGTILDTSDPHGLLMGVGHMEYGGTAVNADGNGAAAGSILMSAAGSSQAYPGFPSFKSIMLVAAHRTASAAGGNPRDGAPSVLTTSVLPTMSSSGAAATELGPLPGLAVHSSRGAASGGWSDEGFVECYRQHGRCWEAYCHQLGFKTESAAKQYYYRHRERLGLDRMRAAGSGVEGVSVIATTSAVCPNRKALLPARPPVDEPVVVSAGAAVDDAAISNITIVVDPDMAAVEAAATASQPPAALTEYDHIHDDARDSAFQTQQQLMMTTNQGKTSLATTLYDAQAAMEPTAASVQVQGPVMLPPLGTGDRRCSLPCAPTSAVTLTDGPNASNMLPLEASDGPTRYRQRDTKGSECDVVATGGPAFAAGDTGGGSLASHIDLLAALRNPAADPLSQQLTVGVRQGSTGAEVAGGGPDAGGAGAGGKAGVEAPAGGANGSGGQPYGVVRHLLLQHGEQQQREGGLGVVLSSAGLGLNLGMLLQGGTPGPARGKITSLITGPSADAVDGDVAGHLPSPGDDSYGIGRPFLSGGSGRQPSSRSNFWTEREKALFHRIYQVHGRDWTRLANALPSKSITQIKTYFHNSRNKRPPTLATPRASRQGQCCGPLDSHGMDPAPNRGQDCLDEMNRPVKRQATGGRGSLDLEFGNIMGGGGGGAGSANVSPQAGGSEGCAGSITSRVISPVVEFSSLMSMYAGGGGGPQHHLQLQQLLFARDHGLHGAAGAGGGGAMAGVATGVGSGGPQTNANRLLSSLLNSLSDLQGGPIAMLATAQPQVPPGQAAALTARGNEETLLSREPCRALQQHPVRQLSGTFAASENIATSSQNTATASENMSTAVTGGTVGDGGPARSSAQQPPPKQPNLRPSYPHPFKLQVLNLNAYTLGGLFGILDRERCDQQHAHAVRQLSSNQDQGRANSGTDGLLAALELAGAESLSALVTQQQLHALDGSLFSWDRDQPDQGQLGDGVFTQQQHSALFAAASTRQKQQPPIGQASRPGRGVDGFTEAVSDDSIAIMEMLLIGHTSEQQQHGRADEYGASVGACGEGGPVKPQPLHLVAPLQASSDALASREVPLAAVLATSDTGPRDGGVPGELLAALVGVVSNSGDDSVAQPDVGGRSTHASGEIPGGGVGGTVVSHANVKHSDPMLQMVIPLEDRLERTPIVGDLDDGEPACKRQRRASKNIVLQQQASLELGPAPLLHFSSLGSVSQCGTAEGGSVCERSLGLTADEALAQEHFLQLHQHRNASASSLVAVRGGCGGDGGLFALVYDLLHDLRSRGQFQRHQPQASQQQDLQSVSSGAGIAASAVSLGPTLANRQVLGMNSGGCGGCDVVNLSAGGLNQNMLRLVPLSAAATFGTVAQEEQQQQQQQQQQIKDVDSGQVCSDIRCLTHLQLNAPMQLSGSGPGKVMSAADVLSCLQLQGERPGCGAGGGGSGGSLLDRFLENTVQNGCLAGGDGQYRSIQGSSGAVQGTWLGNFGSEPLCSPRYTFDVRGLRQKPQHKQQPVEREE